MHVVHETLAVTTAKGISLFDLTPDIRRLLESSRICNGFAVIGSRHTTTAITVNECESRLIEDVRGFLHSLVPPGDRYLHNDIHLRDCPQDEPENAHAHIIAMLMGGSEALPIVKRELALGVWQSVLLVDLDGPRNRRVNVQFCGE